MELAKGLESLVVSLIESQKIIISKLNVDHPTNESVAMLDKAGKNLKEIIYAYETIVADQDLLTAEMVLDMNFFPPGTLSVDKLYRLARGGKIPAVRFDGRVFFSRKALREFVQERCRSSIASVTSIAVKREQKRVQKVPMGNESRITAIPE